MLMMFIKCIYIQHSMLKKHVTIVVSWQQTNNPVVVTYNSDLQTYTEHYLVYVFVYVLLLTAPQQQMYRRKRRRRRRRRRRLQKHKHTHYSV